MNKNAARQILMAAAATATLAGLTGCGTIGTADPLKYDGRPTTVAANALLPDNFERIDLPGALDPEERRVSTLKRDKADIEAAMRAFYLYPGLVERRNRLQDRLLAASEQRCGIYKHYLRRVESMHSTYTGIFTTVLGGAGAIAQSVSGAQALSALAAISSGVGAELKQGMFVNLTADVITTGLEERRRELRAELDLKRKRNPDIHAYTMEAALEDVARFHQACGALAGLEKARDSIKEVRNPGLQMVQTVMVGQERLRIGLEQMRKDPSSLLLGLPLIPENSFDAQSDAASPYGYWRNAVHAAQDRARSLKESISLAKEDLDKKIAATTDAAAKKALQARSDALKDALDAADGKPLVALDAAINTQFDARKKSFVDLTTELIDAVSTLRRADEAKRLAAQATLIETQGKIGKARLNLQVYENALIDKIEATSKLLSQEGEAKVAGLLKEAASLKAQ